MVRQPVRPTSNEALRARLSARALILITSLSPSPVAHKSMLAGHTSGRRSPERSRSLKSARRVANAERENSYDGNRVRVRARPSTQTRRRSYLDQTEAPGVTLMCK